MSQSRPAKPPDGRCPVDSERESCNLSCKYNLFQSDDLTIHSWELKCLDCGLRITQAYRNDEDDPDEADEADVDPAQCPFCDLCGLKPGKNPCDGSADTR